MSRKIWQTYLKQRKDLFVAVVALIGSLFVGTLISFFVLWHLLFFNGGIFYGDVEPFTYMPSISSQFYMWYNDSPSVPNISLFTYWIPIYIFHIFLTLEVTYKMYSFFLAILPIFTMFISTFYIFKTIDNNIDTKKVIFLSAFASIFYFASPINQALFSEPTISWAVPVAMIPIQISLTLLYLKFGSVKHLSLISITLLFSDIIPLWTILLPLFLFVVIIFSNQLVSVNRKKVFLRSILTILVMFVSSSFAILPVIGSYLYGAGGIYSAFSFGFAHGTITYSGMIAQSYSNIYLSLLMAHPSLFLFHFYSADWTLLSLIFISFALAAVLLYFTDMVITFFSVLLFISAFFSKGANPPFGYLYYLLVKYSPPGINGILFDVVPFQILVSISISFLIARFVYNISILKPTSFSKFIGVGRLHSSKFIHSRFFKRTVTISICILSVLSVLSGSLNQANSSLKYYGPQVIPTAYTETISFLNKNDGGLPTVWIPESSTISGAGGTSGVNWTSVPNEFQAVGFPATLSNIPFLPPTFINYLNDTKHIGRYLALEGVKYVIVHNDTTANLSYLTESLSQQEDMRISERYGFITIWENTENISNSWAGNISVVLPGITPQSLILAGLNPLSSILINSTSFMNSTNTPIYSLISLSNQTPTIPSNSNKITNSLIVSNLTYNVGSTPLSQMNASYNYSQVYSSNLSTLSNPLFKIISYKMNANNTLLINGILNLSDFQIFWNNIGPYGTFFSLIDRSSTIFSTTSPIYPVSYSKLGPYFVNLTFCVDTNSLEPGQNSVYLNVYSGGFKYLVSNLKIMNYNKAGFAKAYVPQTDTPGLLLYSSKISTEFDIGNTNNQRMILAGMGNFNLSVGGQRVTINLGNSIDKKTLTLLYLHRGYNLVNISSDSSGLIVFLGVSNYNISKSDLNAASSVSSSPIVFTLTSQKPHSSVMFSFYYDSAWFSSGSKYPEFFTQDLVVVTNESEVFVHYEPQIFAYFGDFTTIASLIFLFVFTILRTRRNGDIRCRT